PSLNSLDASRRSRPVLDVSKTRFGGGGSTRGAAYDLLGTFAAPDGGHASERTTAATGEIASLRARVAASKVRLWLHSWALARSRSYRSRSRVSVSMASANA